MKKGNAHTLVGKGFDARPENINKSGRPKKIPAIEILLIDCIGDDGNEAKAILLSLIKKAKGGDVRAAEIILDRCFGKARQSMDVTSQGESINPYAQIDFTLLSEATLKEILEHTKITDNETEENN